MFRYYSLIHWRQQIKVSKNILKMGSFGNHDNYLILDFEATCEKSSKIKFQEIIEFPCIWVDSNMNVISVFHEYVKPTHNPILTPFCTDLTGITQEMVENEATFDRVLQRFIDWEKEAQNYKGPKNNNVFVTCGNWDLNIMLPDQCKLLNLPVPLSMTKWLNLKLIFKDKTGYYPKSLKDMCRFLGRSFTGKEHCGLGNYQDSEDEESCNSQTNEDEDEF